MAKKGYPIKKANDAVFSRPPFAKEIFTEDNAKLLDAKPGYIRNFIKEYIKSGDIALSAKKSNISTHDIAVLEAGINRKQDISQSLDQSGMSDSDLMGHLRECLAAKSILRDKNGNVIEFTDYRNKLSTLKLIFELKGYIGKAIPNRPSGINALELFEGLNPNEE